MQSPGPRQARPNPRNCLLVVRPGTSLHDCTTNLEMATTPWRGILVGRLHHCRMCPSCDSFACRLRDGAEVWAGSRYVVPQCRATHELPAVVLHRGATLHRCHTSHETILGVAVHSTLAREEHLPKRLHRCGGFVGLVHTCWSPSGPTAVPSGLLLLDASRPQHARKVHRADLTLDCERGHRHHLRRGGLAVAYPESPQSAGPVDDKIRRAQRVSRWFRGHSLQWSEALLHHAVLKE